MAGVPGFEPVECRYQKNRCLTAWRWALNTVAVNAQTRRNMAGVPGFEPWNAGIKTGAYRLAIPHPYNAYR